MLLYGFIYVGTTSLSLCKQQLFIQHYPGLFHVLKSLQNTFKKKPQLFISILSYVCVCINIAVADENPVLTDCQELCSSLYIRKVEEIFWK